MTLYRHKCIMRQKFFRYRFLILPCLLLAFALAWLIVRAFPASENDIRRSSCYVNGRSELCLFAHDDTLVLASDSVHIQGVWINRHWWWPSCDGRVLTIAQGPTPLLHGHITHKDSIKQFVEQQTDSIARLLERKLVEQKELAYYLRSHGVIDEGYTQIATYASMQSRETDSLQRVYNKLKAFRYTQDAKLFHKGSYDVSWYNANGELQQSGCEPIYTPLTQLRQPVILHTFRFIKPWGVYAVRNVPWGVSQHKKVLTVTLSATGSAENYRAVLTKGVYEKHGEHNLPQLFAVDGSAVFTLHGRFIGIVSGKQVKQ